MKTRIASAAIAAGAVALGVLAPATAHASTAAHQKSGRVASSTVFLLAPGQSADVPTWFWGTTTVCGFNLSSRPTTMRLASRTGAAPEYIPIYGYGNSCIREAWWGVPLQVTDLGGSSILVTAS